MGKVKGLDSCYICGRKHEKIEQYSFPDDMPLEFRWCCNCMGYANYMVKSASLEKLIDYYKKNVSRIKRISFIRRAKLIYNIIKVN